MTTEEQIQNNIYLSPKEVLVIGQLITYHTGEIAKYFKEEKKLSQENIKEIEELMEIYNRIMQKLGKEVMK